MKRPSRGTTIPRGKPPKRKAPPLPKSAVRPALSVARPLSKRPPRPVPGRPPKRQVARIIDDSERSLVDVLDSLLNQGVVLNADLVLALADVDLVYVRLSALLVAADRVLPDRAK
jgi:hypothetical protein